IRSNENFSNVINPEQIEQIISWIDPSSSSINHGLELILRGSQDGFTENIFYKKCKNINKTVIVLKVRETTEILGGYNPLTWDKQKGQRYKETNDSFIFALKENGIDSIYSRVKRADCAIYCKKNSGPSFGYSDLYMVKESQKSQVKKFQIEEYE
ncbi:17524_t:CDS:2, partial [Racocetra fulgida]